MNTSKAQDQIKNHIPLTNVDSSRLKAMGFDVSTNTLAIQYPGKAGEDAGPTYHYFNVPPEVWDRLKAADSKGRALGAEILNKFDYQRIEPTTGEKKVVAKDETGEQEQQAAA